MSEVRHLTSPGLDGIVAVHAAGLRCGRGDEHDQLLHYRRPAGTTGPAAGKGHVSEDGERLVAYTSAIAEQLEEIATALERLLPGVERIRQSLAEIAPGVQELTGAAGSVDALDATLAEGFGFGRIDELRRRIRDVVDDPLDDVPRPPLG